MVGERNEDKNSSKKTKRASEKEKKELPAQD